MRVLVITLEFDRATFSGNGTYAACTVRFLRAAGHDVRVLCGAPGEAGEVLVSHTEGGPTTALVSLDKWGTLDRSSDWESFARGARRVASDAAFLGEWHPDVVAGVDWTSVAAYEALFPARNVPLVYNNWRVFSRSDPQSLALEQHAVQVAAATVALSTVDAAHIRRVLLPRGPVFRVAPPLRLDVRAAHQALSEAGCQTRSLVCCVVRLSAEKEPHRFVQAMGVLAQRGALAALGVTPALVGVPRDPYGHQLVAQLSAAVPHAEVFTSFLSPEQLGRAVYARSLLNVHPCSYDSFAQSVIEAAAFGCPTLMQPSGVGAADVLAPEQGLSFAMQDEEDAAPAGLADRIHSLLADATRLAAVGRAAQQAALAMHESVAAEEMTRVLEQVVTQSPPRGDRRGAPPPRDT